MYYYLGDGSYVYEDAGGNVSIVRGPGGAASTATNPMGQGSAVVQQFANLLDYWGRSTIDARTRSQMIQSQNQLAANSPGVAAAQSLASLLPILLLAGGAFLVYKLVAR